MVPPQCGWLCKTEPLFPSGRGVWSGLVRWLVNVVDVGPALSRRRPDISCLSGHTVTNTRRCIFVFRVICKPFLAGHCTMYVTEINKDIYYTPGSFIITSMFKVNGVSGYASKLRPFFPFRLYVIASTRSFVRPSIYSFDSSVHPSVHNI